MELSTHSVTDLGVSQTSHILTLTKFVVVTQGHVLVRTFVQGALNHYIAYGPAKSTFGTVSTSTTGSTRAAVAEIEPKKER